MNNRDKDTKKIVSNEESALSSIPHHIDIPGIRRFAPVGFPVHVAVHEVNVNGINNEHYVSSHAHAFPEVNILIGTSSCFSYEIVIGGRSHDVTAPASVWIPAGVEHAARAVKGSGYFVCIVFCAHEEAFADESTE